MYILEGNIGAGKSTFLRLLHAHEQKIQPIFEPVGYWQKDVYGQSLLKHFYEQPKRWAYTFEMLTMIYRVKEHLKEQQDHTQIKIIERSIYSGHYCFALNSYQQQFMDDMEWHIYQQWFNFLVSGKCLPPKGFIYLRANPEACFKRIKKRNRDAEKTIPLSYVKQIHAQHERFLVEKQGILPELASVPVLILDANQNFEADKNLFDQYAHKIMRFISQTYTTAHINTPNQLSER